MVDNLPCDDCNFRTGLSTCWHFGEMNVTEMYTKAMQGCEKYRQWWTVSTVQSRV
jgi:hypothetical protein